MTITSDTWAIVAATGLGPIAAVGITLWREWARERRDRRLHVFRQLMATRRVGMSADHVNALNLVEVDFYGCTDVQAAWKIYLAHLNVSVPIVDQAWAEDKERLLAKLLFEIARVLGFSIPAMDIFKGGYAPRGWSDREALIATALEYAKGLHEGTRGIKVLMPTPPATPSD